jgi:hypothetical protein
LVRAAIAGGLVKKASEYRAHAAECRQMIALASSDDQKAMLENMAHTWDSLAADRERRANQKRRITKLETAKTPL